MSDTTVRFGVDVLTTGRSVLEVATVAILLTLRFRALMGRYLAVQVRHGLVGMLAGRG